MNIVDLLNYKMSLHNHNNANHIGKYIKQYRLNAGITQETLAALVCVENTTVSMWECCRRIPNRDHFSRLCAVLNMPPTLLDVYMKSKNDYDIF